ncbi:hypothetical protein [Halorussus halobius]|uniref:hypothetical protein n=1 Tax=Halorussus halobius TaxID=1710537 RepID=UPI001091CC89|nr:hypothetical protein [Halorussus halobius]
MTGGLARGLFCSPLKPSSFVAARTDTDASERLVQLRPALLETHLTLKPTLVWLGLTVATGLLATVVLLANLDLLGSNGTESE